MKRRILRYVMLLFLGSSRVFAQQTDTASSRDINQLKLAVEANPDSLNFHKAYIKAADLNNPLLIGQYDHWIKTYPGNINFPFAIGLAFYNNEQPQAKKYLMKVVKLDPKRSDAWKMLSTDAERWGQRSLAIEYMHMASLAAPGNASYAFEYLYFFKDTDPASYRKKVLEFTKRFPADDYGALILYLYAKDLSNEDEQITYWELLHKLYSPAKFGSSADGLEDLWAVYLTRDITKAILLVNELGELNSDWKELKEFTLNILEERRLAQNGDYNKATTLIAQMKKPRFLNIDDFFYLEKADVLNKAGNNQGAFQTLTEAYAENPTDKLSTAMQVYGQTLGKNETVIAREVHTIRDRSTVAAPPFDLGLYTSNGHLSLEDLKGQVVLLTFWFPGCNPCRTEFPHFQSVIDKYKGLPVKFVGINVAPGQDQYVIPFLKNYYYSMIPLRGTPKTISDYHVRGEPANFLIDEKGNVVFKKFRIDKNNHRTLELMINSLLAPAQ